MQLSYLITIVPRSACEDFTAFFKKKGVPLTLRMLGVGTARDNIRRLLGLAETEKEVFMCAIPDAKAQELMRDLVLEMDMDVVGRGITYTIPISSIVGATTLQYLGGLNSPAKEETKMNERNRAMSSLSSLPTKYTLKPSWMRLMPPGRAAAPLYMRMAPAVKMPKNSLAFHWRRKRK